MNNLGKAAAHLDHLQTQADLDAVRRAFPKTPRRQRNAARWAEHRAKMGKKDSLRFGSYLYRPHPAHFKKPPKSPGANENARGERIWARAANYVRRVDSGTSEPPHIYFARVLARVAGMAVKL